jgi:hypothetical protein
MNTATFGRSWNSRPVRPGVTAFHVGWVNYLDEDDAWRAIDCVPVAGPTGFTVRAAPFFFQAPRFADQAAYFESNCRYDVFKRERITASPLGQHLTALDAAHVPGRPFDPDGDGRMDAVLYEGAFRRWNADLIYRVRHGRAPRLEKLIRFNAPPSGDVAARFAVTYTGSVEISPRRIRGTRRAAHWDRAGRLHGNGGFYVRAEGEPQKRGMGIRTARIWDASPDAPKAADIEATFEHQDGRLVLTKHVPAAFFTADVAYPVHTDATSTFYPDPDPETTTVDGLVRCNSSPQTFANERGGAGDEAYPSLTTSRVEIECHANTNTFRYMGRSHILFDTAAIPDGDTVTGATLSLYGFDVVTALQADEIALVAGSPASDTDLVPTDYGIAHFGATEFAPRIGTGSWSTSAYNDFALNASGLAAVSKTGISRFGLRLGLDLDNQAPPWASGNPGTRIRWSSADAPGTTQDPVLVVTHGSLPVKMQADAAYAVRTPSPAVTKGAGYDVQSASSTLVQHAAAYSVTTIHPGTKQLDYRLPGPVALRTLRYAVTQPRLSGVIKDRRGTAINCAAYNVRVNVYPPGNTASPPVATQLVTASNGAWTVSGLASATKYLVTFEHEGTYTPLGDKDIADAAFMTSTL